MGNFSGQWEIHAHTVQKNSFLLSHPSWKIPEYTENKFKMKIPIGREEAENKGPVLVLSADVETSDLDTKFIFEATDESNGLLYYRGEFRLMAFVAGDQTVKKFVAVVWRATSLDGHPSPDDDMGSLVGISKGSGW